MAQTTSDSPHLEDEFLDRVEEVHRQRVGRNFAYTRIGPHAGRYALAIAEAAVGEHFPVTKLEFTSLREVLETANRLNRERLHLSRVTAATIIATSLGIIRFRWRPFLFDDDFDFATDRDRQDDFFGPIPWPV